MLLPLADLVKGRLGNEHMAVLNQRLHIAIEEGEKQSTDMGAINIGIRHDNDFAITALGEIELIADPRSKGRDHGADLRIGKNLVETGLFHVEYLAPQGKDGLKTAVTSLLRAAACGIALDNVDLCLFRILYAAVRQFSGQAGNLQGILAAGKLPGLACRLSCPGRHDGLVDDLLRDGRIFLEVLGKPFRDNGVHNAANLGIPEFRLGLSLELRLADLETDNAGEPLTHVLAGKIAVICL